jgi:hypothetical protein
MEGFQLWKSFHDPGLGHGTGEAQTNGGAGSITVLPLPCRNTGSYRRASRTSRRANLAIGVAAVFC